MANLSCGIVGLPNVGKSTLFKALTKQMVASSNFPFCTIDPNTGIVNLPDERLQKLSEVSKSKKIIQATVTFVDIAGLVSGASKGEGLGNKFLSNIRETDLIIQVVRCFDDDNIIHVAGKVDPLDDIDVVNLELILSDIEMIEKAITKLEKASKSQKDKPLTLSVLQKIFEHMNKNQPIRSLQLSQIEKESIYQYNFLTSKPIIYCANVSEDSLPDMENDYVIKVREKVGKDACVIPICAKLEDELASLNDDEAKEFLNSLNIKENGLSKLIKGSFSTLGLRTFYTTGEQETRAWTIRNGDTAPQAAGKIHTDIEKGFIRAEVISYDDFVKYKGRVGAKNAGVARIEGKNYVVQDDDIILFYHN